MNEDEKALLQQKKEQKFVQLDLDENIVMQKIENLEESSKMQVDLMKQHIQDLENKLKKSEKEVEKER